MLQKQCGGGKRIGDWEKNCCPIAIDEGVAKEKKALRLLLLWIRGVPQAAAAVERRRKQARRLAVELNRQRRGRGRPTDRDRLLGGGEAGVEDEARGREEKEDADSYSDGEMEKYGGCGACCLRAETARSADLSAEESWQRGDAGWDQICWRKTRWRRDMRNGRWPAEHLQVGDAGEEDAGAAVVDTCAGKGRGGAAGADSEEEAHAEEPDLWWRVVRKMKGAGDGSEEEGSAVGSECLAEEEPVLVGGKTGEGCGRCRG